MIEKNRLIQICSECERSSCWHGEFMCENSINANLILKTVGELNELKLEDVHHYSIINITKIFGRPYPFGHKIINGI